MPDALSRFRKRGPSPREAEWTVLADYAQTRLEPGLRVAFLDLVRDLESLAGGSSLAALLAGAATTKVAEAILDGEAGVRVLATFQTAFAEATAQAAKWAAERFSVVPVIFDAYSPYTAATIRAQALTAVRELADTTREGIRAVVTDGLERGVNPREVARDIRGLIGLTERQTRAVLNYRRFLESADPRALLRELRDRRFDKPVEAMVAAGTPLPPEKVDQLVAAYRRRYIAYRAETIARTEAMRAVTTGQRLSWAAALQSGQVRGARRSWYVAKDERSCDFCRAIPALNPDGVGFDEPFQTPAGPLLTPPGHPDCRCSVFTEPVF